MNLTSTISATAVATFLALAVTAPTFADETTTFAYQGELRDSGLPAEGTADLTFSLWDDPVGGIQLGSTIVLPSVPLAEGRFTVDLDFGASAFEGEARWLDIVVNGTPLSPRQPLNRAPYSIRTRGIQVDEDMNVGLGVIPGSSRLRVWNLDAGGGISSTSAGRAIEAITLTGDMAVLGSNQADDGIGVFGQNQPTGNWGYLGSEQYGVYARALDQDNHWGAYFVGRGYCSGTMFVGRENQITVREKFGVHAQTTAGMYGGMYMSTSDEGGWPFYGYAAGNNPDCWHYYDGLTGRWHLNNNGNRLTVEEQGRVGVGVTDPDGQFHVSSNDDFYVILGESHTVSGYGVTGISTITAGLSRGVYGRSDSSVGRGVLGEASHDSGTNVGVEGRSDSPSGFDFLASGAGVNYGSQSSRRWKHNIETLETPLEIIQRLRGVTFDWNADHGGHHDIGFIAEEVGAVIPELVVFESNGIDAIGLDYAKLTPILVEALKEERARREAEVDELRARVDALEALVRSMMTVD